MVSMDNLPDQLVWEIFSRIKNTVDRNSVSLTCKRLHNLDNEQRNYLRVGCGLSPANEALTSLCHRFPNLNKVEITYSGWMPKLGKQLEDRGLFVLSNACPFLTDLSLSYCTLITDSGLGCLASCSKLSSLKLSSTPKITGRGIFSIVVGCKNLTVLHFRCLNVSNLEWLECLGRLKNLEDLCIERCSDIEEDDIMKFGPTWRNIKRLQFDANYRYKKVIDGFVVDRWQKHGVWCESIVELSLIRCLISPIRGFGCLLDKCKNLEKIQLDRCIGARDCDIIGIAKSSRNLRSILIRVPSYLTSARSLTDESLKAVAQNCKLLESVTLSFAKPSLSSFSLDGILSLIKTCPVKELCLDCVVSFNNIGMEALCSAEHLETLELARCQEISNEGLETLARYQRLRALRVTKCLGVTDDGFRPLIGSGKLDVVVVNDCPQVSQMGIQGAAKFVSFQQDSSAAFGTWDRTGQDGTKLSVPRLAQHGTEQEFTVPRLVRHGTGQKLGQVVAAAAIGSHYRPPSPCLPLQQPPPPPFPIQQPPPPPLHLYNCQQLPTTTFTTVHLHRNHHHYPPSSRSPQPPPPPPSSLILPSATTDTSTMTINISYIKNIYVYI
ncbi:hypothetical protein OSB04_003877 [Centaurea solstitialis]|uniref:F-box domain-containing protein n=1 Tax=Centaurea solstitialis TaxID=347529 RepID=A0AA38U671_9ASTR|nr:hypothetical protein OSB04_003877 [Centaurea solstitialis]